MILLSGADLVLPDHVVSSGTLVLDGDRIVDVGGGAVAGGARDLQFDFPQHYIVPGFIDVHVHGVEGRDTLDGGDVIADIAGRMPAFGVTAFCPTSIACSPSALREMLAAVRRARTTRAPAGARVLPAHLESNFISPEFKGVQPAECLRLPPSTLGPRYSDLGHRSSDIHDPSSPIHHPSSDWDGNDILREIDAARPDVGILTVAPELDGAVDLIRCLVADGHHVSLGHSGATYEQGLEGIRAGARQATHLFNRMMPATHRAPGLTGAVLESDDVVAELVCDGVHVHAAMVRVAMAAKRPERIMAITDGTAGSGLPAGSRTTIGGRPITVRDGAYLDDGTLAGSVLTLDRAFARLVSGMGLSLSDAATVCSTTPARALNLQGFGVIAPGAVADLVVLDRDLRVVQTWVAGNLAWERSDIER
ncbi:MAG: N-acetylglucosamine-6-phosphate deacetylase [Acidobacteria bacterium]|nr:MAG: N-acetylglucosamine-6-phosphate deacetylase [Acidobacteriota bacterium]